MTAIPAIPEILAPAYVNRGRKTAIHPNRVCLVGDTALMFCRASNGKCFVVRVDREDIVRVLQFGSWRIANFCRKSSKALYAYTSKNRKIVYLHRLIAGFPDPKTGLEVDHVNRRTLDCRKQEIRVVTKSVNQHNRSPRSEWIFSPTIVATGR